MIIHEDTPTRSSRGRRGRSSKPDKAMQHTPTLDEDDKLPSRRAKHPSNKQQMAKWFYNTLILLFLLLATGLFFFGKQLSGQ